MESRSTGNRRINNKEVGQRKYSCPWIAGNGRDRRAGSWGEKQIVDEARAFCICNTYQVEPAPQYVLRRVTMSAMVPRRFERSGRQVAEAGTLDTIQSECKRVALANQYYKAIIS